MDPENKINKRTIQNGYFDAPEVQNEFGTSCKIVMDKLQNPEFILHLDQLSSDFTYYQTLEGIGADHQTMVNAAIFVSKDQSRPNEKIDSKQYNNINNNPVVNNSKNTKESRSSLFKPEDWTYNLKNNSFPTSGLLFDFPKSIQIEDTLDLLVDSGVNSYRALWVVRVAGLSNVISRWASNTGRLNHSSFRDNNQLLIPLLELKRYMDGYTDQWTFTLTRYMDTMLDKAKELLVNTCTDENAQNELKNWQKNWNYLQRLVIAMYSEELVSQRRLIKWILDRFDKSDICISILFIHLIFKYKSQISKSRTPLRQLISVLVKKIPALGHQSLTQYQNLALKLLSDILITSPDVFIDYLLWPRNKNIINSLKIKLFGNSKIQMAIKRIEQRNKSMNNSLSICSRKDYGLHRTLNYLTFISYDRELIKEKIFNFQIPDTLPEAQPAFLGDDSNAGNTVFKLLLWAVLPYDYLSLNDRYYKKPQVIARILHDWCEGKFDSTKVYPNNAVINDKSHEALLSRRKKELIQRSFLKIVSKAADYIDIADLDVRLFEFISEFLTHDNMLDGQKFIIRLVSCGYLEPHFKNRKALFIQRCLLRIPLTIHHEDGSLKFIDTSERLYLLDSVIKSNEKSLQKSPAAYYQNNEINEILKMKSKLVVALFNELPYLSKYLNLDKNIDSLGDTATLENFKCVFGLKDSDILENNWITPLPGDILVEGLSSPDLSGELKKILIHQIPRSLVYSFLSSDFYNLLTKGFLIKPMKVGLENWRVITKSGVSLLNVNQLCAIARIYQTGNCERSLVDILLWLIDGRCASTVIENMTCVILLQLADQICNFDLVPKVQDVLLKQCLLQKPYDQNTCTFLNPLLTLRRLRKLCISRSLHFELDFQSISTIEKNNKDWLASMQSKLKMETMFESLSKLANFYRAKEVLLETLYPLLLGITLKYEKTSPNQKPELNSYDIFGVKDFTKITTSIFSALNSALSAEVAKYKNVPRQNIPLSHTPQQLRLAKGDSKDVQAHLQRINNASFANMNKAIDTDVFILATLLSASKVLDESFIEPVLSEIKTYQRALVMVNYLQFLINITGLDILGNRLKSIAKLFLDELLINSEINYSSTTYMKSKPYFVVVVLVGGSLISISDLIGWATSRLATETNYSNVGPLLFITEILGQLIPQLEKSYHSYSNLDAGQNWPTNNWKLPEYYYIKLAWSLVNGTVEADLYSSIMSLLVLLILKLDGFSVQSQELESFVSLTTKRILKLANLVGTSSILKQCYSKYIDEFSSSSMPDLSTNADIQHLSYEDSTQAAKITIYSHLESQFSYDVSCFYSNQRISNETKRKLLLSSLFINQPLIPNSYDNDDKIKDYNHGAISTLHQKCRIYEDINSAIDQFTGFTIAEIWHRIRYTVEYWSCFNLRDTNKTMSKDKISNHIKCANSVNGLYKYVTWVFGNNQHGTNDVEIGENALSSSRLYTDDTKSEDLFYLKVLKYLNISEESTKAILNVHIWLVDNANRTNQPENESPKEGVNFSEPKVNHKLEALTIRTAVVLVDQILLEYADLERKRQLDLAINASLGADSSFINDLNDRTSKKFESLVESLFTESCEWVGLLHTNITTKIKFITISKIIGIITGSKCVPNLEISNANEDFNAFHKSSSDVLATFLDGCGGGDGDAEMQRISKSVGLGLIRIIEACDNNPSSDELGLSAQKASASDLKMIVSNLFKNFEQRGSESRNKKSTDANGSDTNNISTNQIFKAEEAHVIDFSREYLSYLLPLTNSFAYKWNPAVHPKLLQGSTLSMPSDSADTSSETRKLNTSSIVSKNEVLSKNLNTIGLSVFFLSKIFISLFKCIKNNPKEYNADKWLLVFFTVATSEKNLDLGSQMLKAVVSYLCPETLNVYQSLEKQTLVSECIDVTEPKDSTGSQSVLQFYIDIVSMLSDIQSQEHRRHTFPLIGKIEPEKLALFKSSHLNAQDKSVILDSISRILPFKSVNFKPSITRGTEKYKIPPSENISTWMLIESFGEYIESEPSNAYWFANLAKFNAKKRRLDVEMNLYTPLN